MKFVIIPQLYFPKAIFYIVVAATVQLSSFNLSGQTNTLPLYKVLTLTNDKADARHISQDKGLNGIWQKLLKLQTTASALHTQAHPDDEQADLLTYLGRGKGVRTAILSLNRGESGGNILGGEFFDRLALLRTEEFLLASAYYGLDDLYFTKLVDFGFSKRPGEAYVKWGKKNILEEMVRVIRINRPLVIVSRFHGTKRDGHGHHQAAGEMSQEAYRLAADPNAFPEQLSKEGLRPWKALKLYRGGVKYDELYNVAINTGEYCQWLGESYKNFSLLGYSFHRSQNGGHRSQVDGAFNQYYERMHSDVTAPEKESSLFDGLDVSIGGIFKLTRESIPDGAATWLTTMEKSIKDMFSAFDPAQPTNMIPHLTRGLAATRSVIQLLKHQPEARFLLQIKERQFMDAINTVLGLEVKAIALPQGSKDSSSFYEPQPTMGFAVPGQTFKVGVTLINRSDIPIKPTVVELKKEGNWKIDYTASAKEFLNKNEKHKEDFVVTVPAGISFSQPYYYRGSIQVSQYTYRENAAVNMPNNNPALKANIAYLLNNELVEISHPVIVSQANLPFGYNKYTLKVAPAMAVNILPKLGIIPKNTDKKIIDLQVELINNQEGVSNGELGLQLSPGLRHTSPALPFAFTKAGEKIIFNFNVEVVSLEKEYQIEASAVVGDKRYTQGYELSAHRDLDQTLLYRHSVAVIKSIDVNIRPGLRVGYIMGVGDEVPAAIRQLGATVHLLGSDELSKYNLDSFDAIIIGTRAYAVRQDLHTYNFRLLAYAKNGGHLIVLFQTPEFIPDRMAAYPAQLPGGSEEVSEEDSPVTILDSNHRVLKVPNRISGEDFNHWVEQRGSKFFSRWDTAYTPIISTHDTGQAPQSGGWLMAAFGKGHYTYCAYSFHRQLPYGVTGAYRLIANLISYGK